jgi:hypothetical protein
MKLQKTALVLADISGYTRFVLFHKLSILHAEQIITELIEAIAEQARFPLSLNKLEGDAAFFVAAIGEDDEGALDDIVAQVGSFFDAFREKRAEQFRGTIGGCRCSACQTVENLALKAFVHVGEVVQKRVGDFEEVAGESVILIHRLLKNSIEADEYLVLTDDVVKEIASEPFPKKQRIVESVDDLGEVGIVVYQPQVEPLARPQSSPLVTLEGLKTALSRSGRAAAEMRTRGNRVFQNVPY